MSRRRRAALLLGLALVLGGLAASDVARRESELRAELAPLVDVLVAQRDLEAGHRLAPADLARRSVPARFAPAGAEGAVPELLTGRRLAVPVARGGAVGPLLIEPARAASRRTASRRGERAAELVAAAAPGTVARGHPGRRPRHARPRRRERGRPSSRCRTSRCSRSARGRGRRVTPLGSAGGSRRRCASRSVRPSTSPPRAPSPARCACWRARRETGAGSRRCRSRGEAGAGGARAATAPGERVGGARRHAVAGPSWGSGGSRRPHNLVLPRSAVPGVTLCLLGGHNVALTRSAVPGVTLCLLGGHNVVSARSAVPRAPSCDGHALWPTSHPAAPSVRKPAARRRRPSQGRFTAHPRGGSPRSWSMGTGARPRSRDATADRSIRARKRHALRLLSDAATIVDSMTSKVKTTALVLSGAVVLSFTGYAIGSQTPAAATSPTAPPPRPRPASTADRHGPRRRSRSRPSWRPAAAPPLDGLAAEARRLHERACAARSRTPARACPSRGAPRRARRRAREGARDRRGQGPRRARDAAPRARGAPRRARVRAGQGARRETPRRSATRSRRSTPGPPGPGDREDSKAGLAKAIGVSEAKLDAAFRALRDDVRGRRPSARRTGGGPREGARHLRPARSRPR